MFFHNPIPFNKRGPSDLWARNVAWRAARGANQQAKSGTAPNSATHVPVASVTASKARHAQEPGPSLQRAVRVTRARLPAPVSALTTCAVDRARISSILWPHFIAHLFLGRTFLPSKQNKKAPTSCRGLRILSSAAKSRGQRRLPVEGAERRRTLVGSIGVAVLTYAYISSWCRHICMGSDGNTGQDFSNSA
jgi:hypothetical protein